MANYLITGGAGFIGSHFCEFILKEQQNDYFVCLDALTYAGDLNRLKSACEKENFEFIQGNICDVKFIDQLFLKFRFDYVVNFAAETHVDRSIKEPHIFFETNVLGTQILLDACLKYGIHRFHQVSTDEVYGSLSLDSLVRWSEDAPLRPSNPYSASKASADLLCLVYHQTYGLNVTISRSCNNFGENQNVEKLIPNFVDRAVRQEKFPIYGTGFNQRDWLYVLDHCRAIKMIITCGRSGEVYNVGADNSFSNLEIIDLILKQMECSETLKTYVPDRLGHDLKYAVDFSKLKALGWRPLESTEEKIKKTILNLKKRSLKKLGR